jgi:GNAT superfamily N-acetyltransferase
MFGAATALAKRYLAIVELLESAPAHWLSRLASKRRIAEFAPGFIRQSRKSCIMSDVEITFDPLRIDYVAAARLIITSYWGVGRSEDQQLRAFTNSICAAALHEGRQVGFGRVTTDKVFFARLGDLMVWPQWRGRGVGRLLVRAFLEHPDLAGVGIWTLNTRDAHALYEGFGFRRSVDGNEMRLDR